MPFKDLPVIYGMPTQTTLPKTKASVAHLLGVTWVIFVVLVTYLPPPQPYFTGGQCVGDAYTISVTWLYNPGTGGSPLPGNAIVATNLLGAIVDISPKLINDDQELETTILYDSGLQTRVAVFNTGLGGNQFILESLDYTVNNQNNPADNCGDPEPIYPPTVVNENDFSTTITINNNDGDTLDFSATYSPTTVTFPMTFSLGGISVSVNLGGVTFNSSGVDSGGNPVPLPDGQPSPNPKPVDEIPFSRFNPPPPAPSPEDFDEEEKTEEEAADEEVGIEIEFVRLDLTTIPSNAKQQFGSGAPNVLYAGWFEFTSEGYNFPRQPIHFKSNLYAKPPGSTGYAYTCYQGFRAKATVYTRKEEA